MSEAVRVGLAGGVCHIEMARPEKKNALTAAMYRTMADALATAEADPAVRVILISGAGGNFTAGNDLADFLETPPMEESAPVFRFIKGFANLQKPFVAAVEGVAIGVGTTMLLHCDLVYAGDNAAFSLPFVNLGLCPEAGSSLLLPQLMGHQRAAEALLLGEPFTAETALELGLINRIVPPAEANALAQMQAKKLAAKPLSSLLETKRLMKMSNAPVVAGRIAEEISSFGRMLREPAAREAFTAFVEKRRPDFAKL